MKLVDLFEGAAPDIIESYKRARKLKSYNALIKMGFTDRSGPVQLGNGIFQFHDSNSVARYYVVLPYGKIRYNAGSTQTSDQKVPALTQKNWLEDYNRMFERVIEIETAKAASSRVPGPKVYSDDEKTWEFGEEDLSFIISDDSLTKLPSDKKIVHSYTLSNLPNLSTLEGGPKQMSGQAAELRKLKLLKNLRGFPKPERDLLVSIIDCPNITSLEGLECTELKMKNLKKLTSLEGLGTKYGKDIETISIYDSTDKFHIQSNILGLAMMKNLHSLTFPGVSLVNFPDWAVEVIRVIRNYEPAERVIELQHALIDANLSSYAEL